MIRLKKGGQYDWAAYSLCQAPGEPNEGAARGDVIDTLLKALDLLEVDGVGVRSLLVEACERHAGQLLHEVDSTQGGAYWDRKEQVKRSRWLLDVADLLKGKV